MLLFLSCFVLATALVVLWTYFVRAQAEVRRLAPFELQLKEQEEELLHLRLHQASLNEKIVQMQEAHEMLSTTFRALSLEALEKNNRSFLELAKATLDADQQAARNELALRSQSLTELVTPMRESLGRLDHQVRSLLETEKLLRQETSSLVKALRAPITRGRWGEIQLRRVVELAGMLNFCDFFEQQHDATEDGIMRPDLIVRLPGERQVIVDAKVPLEAYLEAIQTEDEAKRDFKFKEHARQVRLHVMALSKKAYWERFQPTPEFVILFLPAETFFSAALEHDPSLIEVGIDKNVILATPTTLIALLRAVAYGWKQESLSRHAQEVSELGHELYKRIVDMSGHFSRVGRTLGSSVEAYNKAIGSLESRVLVTARKFKEMGAASIHLDAEPLEMVEKVVRSLEAPDLLA